MTRPIACEGYVGDSVAEARRQLYGRGAAGESPLASTLTTVKRVSCPVCDVESWVQPACCSLADLAVIPSPEEDIAYDAEHQVIVIDADGHPYEVDLDRIFNHMDLLGWVLHLAGKNWMTCGHLAAFAKKVISVKGFAYPTCR